LKDRRPEYYDGRIGRFIGRCANFNQVWSAAALIFSNKILKDSSALHIFPGQSSSIRCVSTDK
jgi:glycogen debranching enzyme